MKVLLTTDPFFHPISHQPTYHKWLLEILRTAILGSNSVVRADTLDEALVKNEVDVSQLPQAPYQPLIGDALLQAQDLLAPMVQEFDLVIGFELSPLTRRWVDQESKNSIVAFIHPVRFHKDWLFSIDTTMTRAMSAGKRWSIPSTELAILAQYWKQVVREKTAPLNLSNNTALLIGQTSKDMSVWDGQKMRNLSDHQDAVSDLLSNHSTVLFKGHPYDDSLNQHVFKTFPGLIETKENVYRLLSADLSHVAAISSSVVEEASLFGIESSYLWQPLFNTQKTDFTIGKRFLSSSFWIEVIDGQAPYDGDDTAGFVDNDDAMIRNVRETHWGYSYLRDLAGSYKSHGAKPSAIRRLLNKIR